MDASQISNDMRLVTPSDDDVCNGVAFVFQGGSCAVETAAGRVVVLPESLGGAIIPNAIGKVLETGTTASTILVFLG